MQAHPNGRTMEDLGLWLQELNDLDEPTVLVEGIRDVKSLRRAGVAARIEHINRGLPLLDFLTDLRNGKGPFEGKEPVRMAVILMDWDRKGGHLARVLKDLCRDIDLPSDLQFRRRLVSITGRWIRDVESLGKLYERLVGGELEKGRSRDRHLGPE